MSNKKSLIIILKIVFVLFSLFLVKELFYVWDGYSYYMHFRQFLPDASLIFILWTIIGLIIAFILWFVAYVFFKMIPKSLIPVRFEHIIAVLIFVVLPAAIKVMFFSNVSLCELIGLSRSMILFIGAALAAIVYWVVCKYIERPIEKAVYGIDNRIAPLVYLFVILLIIAVPFSLSKKGHSENKRTNDNFSEQVISSVVKRPNIILVTMDALTAKDMQVYGYERPTTPFISKWAKDAIVFKRAYASSNWTTPTAMSLMTGQRLWTHKVWYRAFFNPVDSYENNPPKILRDNGYDVYGFIQNGFANPEILGMNDAFLRNDKSYLFRVPEGWWFYKIAAFFNNRPIVKKWIFETNPIAVRIEAYQPPQYTTVVPSEIIYNHFLDLIFKKQGSLKQNSEKPFFAWLHIMPPHGPYLASKPFMGTFDESEQFDSDVKQWKLRQGEYKNERQAEVNILRKRYNEFILYADKQFDLFLMRLSKRTDMSNTIIILSSDHGESFSHNYFAHSGKHLYESIVHIPFIIKMPDKLKNKIIDIPVEQTDIAPTILELAGISVPEWMDGRSLIPLIKNKPFDLRPIFSMQLIENRSFGHPITKGTIAVWEGDYKLIYYLEDKKAMLFNVMSDPDEMTNISQQKKDVTKRLTGLIIDNLAHANAKITKSAENNF